MEIYIPFNINHLLLGTVMNRSKKITLGILVLALWFLPVLAGADQKSLTDEIKFLDGIKNVGWYKVDGQNIIIGWKRGSGQFLCLEPQDSCKCQQIIDLQSHCLVGSIQPERLGAGRRRPGLHHHGQNGPFRKK